MPEDIYKDIALAVRRHFGLDEQPFSMSPSPRYLYLAERHKSILGKIEYAIVGRQGLNIVIGDVGSGKTTLSRHLYDLYRDLNDYATVYLTNPHFPTPMQFLKAICAEFGLESKRSMQQQMQEFQEEMTKLFISGKNIIIIIDEAQLLRGSQFEVLRQFLNFETNETKLIQIVLFGQTELRQKLRYKKAVQSRIITSSTLDSFDLESMAKMITFRLTVAGRKEALFTEDAIKAIYDLSKGIPRDVIKICYNALPLAYLEGINLIDKNIINKAYEEATLGKS